MTAPWKQMCACNVRHIWFSYFDEDRKATHHCALLLSISAAVTSFPRGIAKKSEQNLMFFSTRQKFAAFPEVLIELEGKGNNVSWTWKSWRRLVFQYTGYLTLAGTAWHGIPLWFYGPLWAKDFVICCHGEKNCTWLSKDDVCVDMWKTMSQFQLTKPNLIEIYYWAVRIFLINFFQEVTLFLSSKTMWRRHNPL